MKDASKMVEMRFRADEIRRQADIREARRAAQARRDAATQEMWERLG